MNDTLCQSCKEESATVKCTQIINSKKTELVLCHKCAEKLGLTNPLAGIPEVFGKIFANLIGNEISQLLSDSGDAPATDDRACQSCGITVQEFQKRGTLGCAECYTAFAPELKILLKRLQGSQRHLGSRPRRSMMVTLRADIRALQNDLQQAVTAERYERAAELRNMIRAKEKELAVFHDKAAERKKTHES